MENKPASSLVVFLGKAHNGTPPPLCEKQMAQRVARPGEGWARPGVSALDSLHDEHNQKQIGHLQRPNANCHGISKKRQKLKCCEYFKLNC